MGEPLIFQPSDQLTWLTPSQTVGPFFHDCLLRDDARCDVIVGGKAGGVPIHVSGHVFDADRNGVPDAVIEIWQADSDGRYQERSSAAESEFTGFARVGTDERGAFSFTSIKPGRVAFDDTTTQAPHLSVAVFARGLLNHLHTRIYFEDDPATARDPILGLVPDHRRGTLIARLERGAAPEDLTRYRFDVVLQGAGETAFFDFRRPQR